MKIKIKLHSAWFLPLIICALCFCLGMVIGAEYWKGKAERSYLFAQQLMAAPEITDLTLRHENPLDEITANIQSLICLSSWYGPVHHGRKTASGEIFDMNAMTVAHKFLPLGAIVFLENPANHKSAIARITDRGPYIGLRSLDCSKAVAVALGFEKEGIAVINLTVLKMPERTKDMAIMKISDGK